MIGQGVLRECLLDSGVESVLAIVRKPTGTTHRKLRERIHKDFFDFSGMEKELTGLDACFFCLGVSSAGMGEERYRTLTYDLTLGVARTLARLNPSMTFIYVSGAGADSTEKSRIMWARVRGKTENDLLRLPFRGSYVFRPAAVTPRNGIQSSTRLYRFLYTVLGPLLPLLNLLFPKYVTSTDRFGRAMLEVARHGASKRVLENDDINEVVRQG